MRHGELLREVLLQNTIRLIAEGGFEKTTTRAIVSERARLDAVRLNESHIYRLFGSKEGLFGAAFAEVDNELLNVFYDGFSGMEEWEDHLKAYSAAFHAVWRYLLSNEEKCRFYVRYYYSDYFMPYSQESHITAHKKLFHSLHLPWSDDKNMIVWHHALLTLFDCAIRVHNNEIEEGSEVLEQIFQTVCLSDVSVLPKRKKSKKKVILPT